MAPAYILGGNWWAFTSFTHEFLMLLFSHWPTIEMFRVCFLPVLYRTASELQAKVQMPYGLTNGWLGSTYFGAWQNPVTEGKYIIYSFFWWDPYINLHDLLWTSVLAGLKLCKSVKQNLKEVPHAFAVSCVRFHGTKCASKGFRPKRCGRVAAHLQSELDEWKICVLISIPAA